MNLRHLRYLIPIVVILTLAQVLPLTVDGAENVLVVRNGSSPISLRVSAYYMAKRDIPADNLCTINTLDSATSAVNESISYNDYFEKIEKPVRAHLAAKGLVNKVQYIVLTKGIPIKMVSDPGRDVYGESVDSMLATIDLANPVKIRLGSADKCSGMPFLNEYWRSTEPFSHAKYGGYLVTRLDGYTEDDAIALVDRAMAAQPSPVRVLLDASSSSNPQAIAKSPMAIRLPDGTPNKDCQMGYEAFNADLIRASQVISGRPNVIVELEQTRAFVGSAEPVTCYISWGSNAGKAYKPDIYHSLKFTSRSIVETAVSTSARTFLRVDDKGQSNVADLIAQGAAGAKGYVTEPFLHSMASPTVLLDLYTSGRNLAESYYAASRFIGWKDIVLGDPLCKLDVAEGTKQAPAK